MRTRNLELVGNYEQLKNKLRLKHLEQRNVNKSLRTLLLRLLLLHLSSFANDTISNTRFINIHCCLVYGLMS